MRVSSYDRDAPTPEVGTTWTWEPDKPLARCVIEITEVKWNGEEWWVKGRTIEPAAPLNGWMYTDSPWESRVGNERWNDLSRFWEACKPGNCGQEHRWRGPRVLA